MEYFEAAAACVSSLAFSARVLLDDKTKLELYSLYKQATEGSCDVPKPNYLDFAAKSKWQAWKNVEDLSKDEAKQMYVALVDRLLPEWKSLQSRDALQGKAKDSHLKEDYGSGFSMVPSVSRFVDSESSASDNDDIFCATIRGDVDRVVKLIEAGVDVDICDEDGQRPLHFAADRGRDELVKLLVQKFGSDVNRPTNSGSTPLHLACCSEYPSTVKLLVALGADVHAQDEDGCTPADETLDEEISNLLSRIR